MAPHLDGSPEGPVGPCGEGLGISETPNLPPVSPSLPGGSRGRRPLDKTPGVLGTGAGDLGLSSVFTCTRRLRSWFGSAHAASAACSGWAPHGPRAARAASQAEALGLSGNGPLPLLSSGSRPDGQSAPQGPSLVCFLPRAKVILAPRCHLSDPTCWPCSLTSPAGPHCISVSASCWARTGSRGEHPSPHPSPQARRHGGSIEGPSGHVAQPWNGFLHWASPPWGYGGQTVHSSDGVCGCCPHRLQGSPVPPCVASRPRGRAGPVLALLV